MQWRLLVREERGELLPEAGPFNMGVDEALLATALTQEFSEAAVEMLGPYGVLHDRSAGQSSWPQRYLTDRAMTIAGGTSEIQRNILAAFRQHKQQTGRGLTDPELERLPQFSHCGYSSVRKRRTELTQMGYVRPTGETRTPRPVRPSSHAS